jgi:hypothetical protein
MSYCNEQKQTSKCAKGDQKLVALALLLFCCISFNWAKAQQPNSVPNLEDIRLKQSIKNLANGFSTPPDSAKPWVNMWWFNEVMPANITQHLTELKAKGAGGAMLIDLGNMPNKPYMSDGWRELFRHAVREADRVGLKLGVNTCPGWPSGGPWITPEYSSWSMVHSEMILHGGTLFSGKITDPASKGKVYKQVAIQAFPIAAESISQKPTIILSSNQQDLPNILDGNFNTFWDTEKDEKPSMLFDFGQPHGVDYTWLDLSNKVLIESSDDGINFKTVTEIPSQNGNPVYQSIPTTTARWYKISLSKNTKVRDIALGSQLEVERIARLAAKRATTNPLGVTGTRQIDQVNLVREDLVNLSTDQPLKIDKMIDLTAKVSEDGVLTWQVPPGKWKIVQIGRTTTDLDVAFGKGLLADYLSPKATELNYEKGIKPLIGDAGSLAGKTLKYFIEDNVEINGIYSWSPELLQEFKTRRGYDPSPYLAALAGEIVTSVEITDRFLADMRRTIADCVADGHYGRWAELSHADGIKVRAEAGGQHHPRLLCNDGLMNQGRMDVPVAEFWELELWKENQFKPADHHVVTTPGWDEGAQNVNAKQAASAGHLYGKKVVASEAFTTGGDLNHWSQAPGRLIRHANNAFCEGINMLSIHGSATSGPESGLPGKGVFGGVHFNHNITWWNQGAEQFLRYLTRCSYILQQGLFVADVLYYSGDEAPNFIPPKNIDPSRGFGYDYDVCNSEILLTRLSVKDGRLVLPDGMSYAVLVLPNRPVMPLSVAKKIEDLVAAGATIIGPKPQRTPGLTNFPSSEVELKSTADKVWGLESSPSKKVRSFGKGKVINGLTIREVLLKNRITPDFSVQTADENTLVDFIHRQTADAEIYFVVNKRSKVLKASFTFRVTGKQPQLWSPVTGEQRNLPVFTEKNGSTILDLQFEPYQALFVVFKKDQKADQTIKGEVNFPALTKAEELAGPWKIQFDPKWFYPTTDLDTEQAKGILTFDHLEDWNKRSEPAIKNFSGAALYTKTFKVASLETGKRYFLDLGDVRETAQVTLNGKDLGVLWSAPYRVDITSVLQKENNELKVNVINTWTNRIVGDRKLPKAQKRSSITLFVGWLSNAQLPGGLLGPVTIQTNENKTKE